MQYEAIMSSTALQYKAILSSPDTSQYSAVISSSDIQYDATTSSTDIQDGATRQPSLPKGHVTTLQRSKSVCYLPTRISTPQLVLT